MLPFQIDNDNRFKNQGVSLGLVVAEINNNHYIISLVNILIIIMMICILLLIYEGLNIN